MLEAMADSLLMHGQVPFAMVSLLDHVRKRDLPPELRCRQVRLMAHARAHFVCTGLRSSQATGVGATCKPRDRVSA